VNGWLKGFYFAQAFRQDYNDSLNFVVEYLLPVFKYLFFIGMVGAIPVIIITAARMAKSLVEQDDPARDHKV